MSPSAIRPTRRGAGSTNEEETKSEKERNREPLPDSEEECDQAEEIPTMDQLQALRQKQDSDLIQNTAKVAEIFRKQDEANEQFKAKSKQKDSQDQSEGEQDLFNDNCLHLSTQLSLDEQFLSLLPPDVRKMVGRRSSMETPAETDVSTALRVALDTANDIAYQEDYEEEQQLEDLDEEYQSQEFAEEYQQQDVVEGYQREERAGSEQVTDGEEVQRLEERETVGSAKCWPGIRMRSKQRGTVLVFRIDEDTCQTFAPKTKTGYICVTCRSRTKAQLKFKVSGDTFMENPLDSRHVAACSPLSYASEVATRGLYETTQKLRDSQIRIAPLVAHGSMLRALTSDPTKSVTELQKVGDAVKCHKKKVRRTLSRATNANKNKSTTMRFIDPQLQISYIPSDPQERFVQIHTEEDLIVCFTRPLIELVVQQGITHIISDGCHRIQPHDAGDNGQLYTIHGITQLGQAVPLLHSYLKDAKKVSYTYLFDVLRKVLNDYNCQIKDLTFVVDFERGAIGGIRQVFGGANVQGCSFHFAMAINRRITEEGLTPFLHKYKEIRDWRDRMLALTFLPPNLIDNSGILANPVGRKHAARAQCDRVLEYFENTWRKEPFQDMWNKYGQNEHRTSNSAESFHSVLYTLLNGVKHPALADSLRILNTIQLQKYFELRNSVGLELRPEDETRRSQVAAEMAQFQDHIDSCGGDVPEQDILDYLDRMSVFVTRKRR